MLRKRIRSHFNIGILVYGAIFIYFLITLIFFISHRHVDTYQVVTGPLSGNDTCTALILREEDVVRSTSAGYVNHFVSNGSKTAKKQPVCAVTDSPLPNKYKNLTPSEYSDLRLLLSRSSLYFDPVRFESADDLRFDILGSLWNAESISESAGNFYKAAEDGYIAFSTDGKESLTEENLSPDLFKTSVYSLSKIANQSVVDNGDVLYRIVNTETWSICFPITDKQLVRLARKPDLMVRFLKDGTTESGTLTFFENEAQRYAKITLQSGMHRFIDDRYADIELYTNSETGLKLPVSAIVKKDFYAIPESFISGTTSEEATVIREAVGEDGTKTNEFVEVTLYAGVTDPDTGQVEYYVDKSLFNEGDILVSPGTDEKYMIGKTGTLEGVFCVNKGYAVFRKISIIDQNEEYCIIQENTSYGVSPFDYIVKNGKSIKEAEIIY